jgi:hypothetical protein
MLQERLAAAVEAKAEAQRAAQAAQRQLATAQDQAAAAGRAQEAAERRCKVSPCAVLVVAASHVGFSHTAAMGKTESMACLYNPAC